MSSEFEPTITPEMRERYLARRHADVIALHEAFANRDFDAIKAIAHQIKGNASTFCFEELERLSIRLEEQAHAESAETKETITAIEMWLAKVAAE